MKTIIVILVFLFSVNCHAQKKSYADSKAFKFLTGMMFYEQQNNDKLSTGFFLGAEFELPMTHGSGFAVHFVPELNYWTLENYKNLAFGTNIRGKFKAGNTRPYIDAGITYNRLTRASVDYNVVGVNAGAGIDIQLSKTNISVVIDFKVRAHFIESIVKAGFSLTPGIRIAF